jgi:hypothetical protein
MLAFEVYLHILSECRDHPAPCCGSLASAGANTGSANFKRDIPLYARMYPDA